ncbi:DUF882 domain-containing protein [Acuticoccus sp. MNP-M23]|uniref:DUF882 domain-containing protein n=1 Tax=Acuticoccus sp. MNP-M23 TaxID=3072793 RepID=UPI0035C19B40
MRRVAGLVVLAVLLGVVAAKPAAAQTRTLELFFTHTKESIKVVYKRNGRYDAAGLRDLNRFLRDWRRNESTKMDPELFDLIWDVQQQFGGKKISVVSAYRSPATNSMLRGRSRGVAKNSQHMLGKAMDFYIPGVKISTLRAAGMKRQVGGVGYYPRSGSPFVHFDTGSVRAWPRMSSGQLSKLFPDGKTLHLPSNGKALSGYSAAQALEKQGKLASLDTRGGNGGGGGGLASLFNFGGGRKDVKPPEPKAIARRPKVQKAPERKAAPAPVQVAAAAPAATVRSSTGDGNKGFRQLPGVSLGGLIGRFRRNNEPAEVTPVALPSEPLTAVAVAAAAPAGNGADDEINSLLTEAPADASPPPIPRIAPREGLAVVAAPDDADDPKAADALNELIEDNADSATAEIQLAALPPHRPEVLRDAPATALGFADSTGALGQSGTPQSAAAALISRPATNAVPPAAAATLAPPASAGAPILKASFTKVRGASPVLIGNTRGMADSTFATLSAPDEDGAAKGGLLLADGFLGAPSGFAAVNAWPNTNSFTGLRITVYAAPRS